jgi:arylsulfatase A-like enzyme
MAGLHTWLHRGVGDVVSAGNVTLPPYYPDLPEVRGDIARHYNNIRTMDRRVGELLAALEEDGLADDTIVIWTADHGDGLPRAKRELFDSGIRVPMIVRWPEKYRPSGIEPGDLDHRLISFVDLAPQILDWAGVAPPESIQGRPFLKGAPRRWRRLEAPCFPPAASRPRNETRGQGGSLWMGGK